MLTPVQEGRGCYLKAYKVWNEWQLHTGELIAYTLIWALQCNQVSTRHLKCFRGVQISQGPPCFHFFIMLSFFLNPLLGSQRLKKLLYLLGYSWKVKQKTVNLWMRVRFPLSQQIWGYSLMVKHCSPKAVLEVRFFLPLLYWHIF